MLAISVGACAQTAGGASAAELCVGFAAPAASCNASYAAGSLADALDDARTNHLTDLVRIAPGVYSGSFDFSEPDNDVIAGSGSASTIIESASGSQPAVSADGGGSGPMTIRDLTIRKAGGAGLIALAASRLNLTDVVVRYDVPAVEDGTAAYLGSSTVERARFEVAGTSARAVELAAGATMTMSWSNVVPLTSTTLEGMRLGQTSHATVVRTKFASADGAASFLRAIQVDGAKLDLWDSLIELGSRDDAVGVRGMLLSPTTADTTLYVIADTIVGTGARQTGVVGYAETGDLDLRVVSSAMQTSGPSSLSVSCRLVNPAQSYTLMVRYSAIRATDYASGAAPCAMTNGDANVSIADMTDAQLFLDPASRDWRPRFGSPLVDTGADTVLSPVDLRSKTRAVDGRGVGVSVTDIGAYEYQHQAPFSPHVVDSGAHTAGTPSTFSQTVLRDWDDEPLVSTWNFGDGATATGSTVTHTYAASGSYALTVTVTDPSGLSSTAISTVVVRRGVVPDTTPPLISLSLPRCHRRMTKAQCAAYLVSRKTWHKVGGTVVDRGTPPSGVLRVELAVYRKAGKVWEVAAPRKVRIAKSLAAAKVPGFWQQSGVGWSFTLPRIKPDVWTIRYRAIDKAGNATPWAQRSQRLK